uniref:Uncharacterized protein n=1 Tax=Rhizophora mucronata TaxID=61149 RepID=A0A2P2J0W3_RHIMU
MNDTALLNSLLFIVFHGEIWFLAL